MARYVEAVECAEIISEKLNIPLGDLVDIFAEIPTADVEQVVRCKDCIHARQVKHRGEVIDWSYRCSYLKPNTNMFDIDYCRYAKRKDTAHKEG